MRPIDYESTDEVVCPYCGYEFSDSTEYMDNDTEDCDNCGKTFSLSSEVSVSYTTARIPCLDGELHKWKINNVLINSFNNGFIYIDCENCHERKRITKEELGKYGLKLEASDEPK